MLEEKPKGININMDPEMSKGVHGQDVAITVTEKDVCLTFFVRDPSGTQGFVTARVFIPHTTAIQLSELLKKLIGPTYEKFLELKNNLPPTKGGMTS